MNLHVICGEIMLNSVRAEPKEEWLILQCPVVFTAFIVVVTSKVSTVT